MAIFLFPAKVYGLGFPLNNTRLAYDIKLLNDIKGRSPNKYYTLISNRYAKIAPFVDLHNNIAVYKVIQTILNRKLHITVIVPASKLAPKILCNENNAISFRIADNVDSKRLMEKYPMPFITTSANISGQKPIISPKSVKELRLNNKIKVIKSSRYNITGEVSAVLDLSGDKPKVIRYGRDLSKLSLPKTLYNDKILKS
jgi:L-threonylcarbamoyladenylate synthase